MTSFPPQGYRQCIVICQSSSEGAYEFMGWAARSPEIKGGVMKKFKWQLIVLACLFVTLTAVSEAQTVGLTLDVPFKFTAGEKVLPAGHYLSLAPQGGTLKMLGPNGAAAVAMTNQVSGNGSTGPGIVDFNCYGS